MGGQRWRPTQLNGGASPVGGCVPGTVHTLNGWRVFDRQKEPRQYWWRSCTMCMIASVVTAGNVLVFIVWEQEGLM